MTRKRKHSPPPGDAGDGQQQDNTSQSTLLTKKVKPEQPRKANGRFVRMKKGSSTKRTSTVQKSSPKSRQDNTTTSTSPAQPAETTISNATQHTLVQVEPSNSSPSLTSLLATSRSPPPVQIPHTPVSSASRSRPSLLASGEQRMSQDQRTSAIVSWLQYTRTYEQNEHLVHPFNLPPLARVRPVAMYQRQYARDRGLVAGLPESAFGKAEEVGERVESGEQGYGERDDPG